MITHLTLFKKSVFVMALIIMPLRSSSQDLESKISEPIKIRRIKSPIELDGMSNEQAWEGIESLPMLMRIPIFGNKPSEHTEILLGYDDDYLYVSGRFHYSNITDIQAASFKRDFWHWSSDFIGITLDTFDDNENGVVFLTSPTGTRTDANILNDAVDAPYKNVNLSWNTFWDVATMCNDDGWFSEMRIPFSSAHTAPFSARSRGAHAGTRVSGLRLVVHRVQDLHDIALALDAAACRDDLPAPEIDREGQPHERSAFR